MLIWVISRRELRDKFVCGLNDEKIQERLLSEDMSLEEVFKMAQAMELVTVDVARIKNKDTEDFHKMCTIKQNSAEIQKGEKVLFWAKKHMCRQKKPCFKCQKEKSFLQ